MKLLIVSDHEEKALWDYYHKDRVKGVDLMISLGDLKADYLEFLVTMVNKPLLYIPGNHDTQYVVKPPEGCDLIDGDVYDFRGLRILGLGGCMRYKDGPYQYTEAQMARRIRKLAPKITLMGGFDVLVTHAPAKGFGDLQDLPHNGFSCFNELTEKWNPKYHFYGHVHREYVGGKPVDFTAPCGTRIFNCSGYRIVEIDESEYSERGKTGSFLYDYYMSMKEKQEMKRTGGVRP